MKLQHPPQRVYFVGVASRTVLLVSIQGIRVNASATDANELLSSCVKTGLKSILTCFVCLNQQWSLYRIHGGYVVKTPTEKRFLVLINVILIAAAVAGILGFLFEAVRRGRIAWRKHCHHRQLKHKQAIVAIVKQVLAEQAGSEP